MKKIKSIDTTTVDNQKLEDFVKDLQNKIDNSAYSPFNDYYKWSSADCDTFVPYLECKELDKINTDKSNFPQQFKSVYQFIVERFFTLSTLTQFERQKELFQRNKETPYFKHLLFHSGNLQDKHLKKVKLLLDWGWNPNEKQLDTSIYRNNLKDATLLHITHYPKICALLIEAGANTKAKCHIHSDYQLLFQQGLTQIETEKERQKFLQWYSKVEGTDRWGTRILENYKDWSEEQKNNYFKPFQVRLQLSQKEFTPYELELHFGNKKKYLFLQQFENKNEIDTKLQKNFELIAQQVKSGKRKSAIKLLFQELKLKNKYMLDNILELKPILDSELVFRAIKENQLELIQKIIPTGLINPRAQQKSGLKESLIAYAISQNKPKIYEYFYNLNYHHGLKGAVQKLNEKIEDRLSWGVEWSLAELLEPMSATIIYDLAKKGFRFNEPTLLALSIETEKNMLNENLIPAPNQAAKQFKL